MKRVRFRTGILVRWRGFDSCIISLGSFTNVPGEALWELGDVFNIGDLVKIFGARKVGIDEAIPRSSRFVTKARLARNFILKCVRFMVFSGDIGFCVNGTVVL